MKFQSLKRSFQKILISLIGLYITTGIIILLLGNQLFSEVNRSLNAQSMVSDYFLELNELQNQMINQLTNTSQQSVDEHMSKLNELEQLSFDIKNEMDSPQFTDLYYQTGNYSIAANLFLEADPEHSETIEKYQSAQVIGELISNRYIELTAAKEDILLAHAENFTMIWQRTLFMIITFISWLSAIIAAIGFRFVKRTITPIVHLTKQTEALAKGEMDIDDSQQIIPKQNNETRVLSIAFYKMAAIIQDQLEQLKEKIEMNKQLHQLEIDNMQMQVSLAQTENMFTQSLVNPHFLFNCLNTLASIAYIENAPKATKTATIMARFLRESLGRLGKEITVKQELEHLQQYLDIQKLRFEERIAFRVYCDPKCDDSIMPAMIIQPLVENAISHGVGSYVENGRIEVRVELEDIEHIIKDKECNPNDKRNMTEDKKYIEQDEKQDEEQGGIDKKYIVIVVTDNGVGISQEKIQQILQESYKEFPKRERSFGLRSILTRLRMSYGDSAKFSIESHKDETIAMVKLPFRLGEKNK